MTHAEIPPPTLELVRGVHLFDGLSPDEVEAIVRQARWRRLPAGRVFFHEGDPATHFYVLVEGRLKMTQVSPEGHETNLLHIGPGDPFGGVAAFAGGTYPVTASVVDDATVLAWDGAAMARVMERHPKVAINALRVVAGRFHELQVRHRQAMTERVERRIARVLLKLVAEAGKKTEAGVLIDFPVSRQDLAEMTGTTVYTVSRILSGWQHQGIAQSGRRRITIREPQRLMKIAEEL